MNKTPAPPIITAATAVIFVIVLAALAILALGLCVRAWEWAF